ncbi:DUF6232 family protein [Micromonospora sp. WMMD708]|uniref:DUF6232 family protein n=1 Tax=Micromonospora sp. WMMD708 TaxID=3403464 RepID=UPI003BF60817
MGLSINSGVTFASHAVQAIEAPGKHLHRQAGRHPTELRREGTDLANHGGITQLRINRATLWIGSDVYQLRNIARVQSLVSTPDRAGVTRAIVKTIGWLFGLMLAVCCAAQPDAPSTVGVIAALVFLALAGYSGWTAFRIANQATQYALVLETNGAPSAGLVSTDGAMVEGLVGLIANAMENPPAREIVQNIDNRKLVFGDEINMKGSGLQIGKVVRGG